MKSTARGLYGCSLIGGAVVLLWGACADPKPQYPPLITTACRGGSCSSPVAAVGGGPTGESGGGGGAMSGAGGTAGDNGGAGAAGASADATVSVSATVGVVNDTTFVPTALFTRTANITTATPQNVVAGSWDGSTAVALANVRTTGGTWFTVDPTDASTAIRGTLTFLNLTSSTTPLTLQLPVVSEDVLTAALSQLSSPVSLDTNAPQVVALFKDPQGAPVAGITVSSDATAAIGYDQGDGFGGLKTGARGIAVLLNVQAAGAAMKLTFLTTAGTTTDVAVQLANQRVSILTIPVP